MRGWGMKKSFMERLAAFIVDKRRRFVVLFAVAALMLIAGYAMTDDVAYAHPWYTIALAALVPAFLISLLIAQNEKQLPKDLQQK